MKQNENTAALFVEKVVNYHKTYKSIISKQINLDSYPTEIYFETSDLCNANCIMCAKFSAYLFDRLNEEEIRNIYKRSSVMKLDYLEYLFKSGVLDYCFFTHIHGFGEPLLNKNLIKFIQLLRVKACNTDFFTNAMLLKENLAKKIVEYSVENISVSFYGGTKETYEQVMRNCDFDIVVNNLKGLNDYKDKTNSKYPKVGFNLAVMQCMFKELPRIAQLAALVGASSLSLAHLQVYDFIPQLKNEYKKFNPIKDFMVLLKLKRVCSKNNIELALSDFMLTLNLKKVAIITKKNIKKDTNAKIKSASKMKKMRNIQLNYNEYSYEELSRMKQQVNTNAQNVNNQKCLDKPIFEVFKNDNLPYVENYVDLNEQKENFYKTISKIYSNQYPIYCFQPFMTMFIKQTGKVKPCCFWRDDYPGFELGDLNTQSIEDIWNGEKFQALRGAIIKGYVPFSCYYCLTSALMPKAMGYPNVIGMEKISKSKFLGAIQNRFEVIYEVSRDNMENVRFINLSVEGIEGENVIFDSTNKDPQIIFDIKDKLITKNIFIFIKVIIAKLRDTTSLEVFYTYNNEYFTEQNKIHLPFKEGENFLWCFIPNEEDIPIRGIRIDPVSEQAMFNIQFIFVCTSCPTNKS